MWRLLFSPRVWESQGTIAQLGTWEHSSRHLPWARQREGLLPQCTGASSSSRGPGSRAQAGESRPCGHSRGSEQGEGGARKGKLTSCAWKAPLGLPAGGTAKDSTQDSKEWCWGESNQLPPSRSLYSFFIEGQDNCWHQTFISFLNIAVLTLAAGLHGEGIQCLIDSSWSST